MKVKPYFKLDPRRTGAYIFGIIFLLFGFPFFGIGYGISRELDQPFPIPALIFIGFGFTFFSLGSWFVINKIIKKKAYDHLMATGKRYPTEIVKVEQVSCSEPGTYCRVNCVYNGKNYRSAQYTNISPQVGDPATLIIAPNKPHIYFIEFAENRPNIKAKA